MAITKTLTQPTNNPSFEVSTFETSLLTFAEASNTFNEMDWELTPKLDGVDFLNDEQKAEFTEAIKNQLVGQSLAQKIQTLGGILEIMRNKTFDIAKAGNFTGDYKGAGFGLPYQYQVVHASVANFVPETEVTSTDNVEVVTDVISPVEVEDVVEIVEAETLVETPSEM